MSEVAAMRDELALRQGLYGIYITDIFVEDFSA